MIELLKNEILIHWIIEKWDSSREYTFECWDYVRIDFGGGSISKKKKLKVIVIVPEEIKQNIW